MGIKIRYPADHGAYLERCDKAGQSKPTPLLLQYGPGDYNCLHQDLYGEHVFPLQATVLLLAAGRRFRGRRIRADRAAAADAVARRGRVACARASVVIFPVHHRPVQGTRGIYRVNMRHGVSRIREGRRHTLGVIFHDAQVSRGLTRSRACRDGWFPPRPELQPWTLPGIPAAPRRLRTKPSSSRRWRIAVQPAPLSVRDESYRRPAAAWPRGAARPHQFDCDIVRHAAFDRGRQRDIRHALAARHRKRLHASRFDLGFADAPAGEIELHLVRHQRLHRRRRAAIGNVDQFNPGQLLQPLDGEVRRGADAGRGVAELAGLAFARAMNSCKRRAARRGLRRAPTAHRPPW